MNRHVIPVAMSAVVSVLSALFASQMVLASKTARLSSFLIVFIPLDKLQDYFTFSVGATIVCAAMIGGVCLFFAQKCWAVFDQEEAETTDWCNIVSFAGSLSFAVVYTSVVIAKAWIEPTWSWWLAVGATIALPTIIFGGFPRRNNSLR